MNEDKPSINTDRELFRVTPGDYYSDKLFVTVGGGIGMDAGGHVNVKTIREWMALESRAVDAEKLAGLVLIWDTLPSDGSTRAGEIFTEILRLARLLAPVAPAIERAEFTVQGPSGDMQAVAFRNAPLKEGEYEQDANGHLVPFKPQPGAEGGE